MTVKWKAVNHQDDYQMNIFVADAIAADELIGEKGDVFVNVFNGSHNSRVKIRVVKHSDWVTMKTSIDGTRITSVSKQSMKLRRWKAQSG